MMYTVWIRCKEVYVGKGKKKSKMAVSKTMTSRQMSGHLSMDTDPLSPQNDNRSPIFSLSSNNMSTDALAGPQDASRRSTQELKQEAKHAESRPEHLSIEKLPAKSVSRSRSGQREELDQVGSELQAQIHDKLEDMSINKGQDSSYSSMSSGDSFSCSSMPSANWEDELKQYTDKMPPDIRMGYIDVLILYCEEDREQAEKFQQHLREEIDVPNGPVQTLLYDDAEMQAICGSKIQHLAKGVERSTYVFIFMTKNFIDDKWCEFSSESCLMEAITNPLKQWCVVPVYTEKRNSSFRVPMGLNTLKGINYYNNDRFYKNGVARLIGDKTCVRVQANEEHKIKQKRWLEEYKREQIVIREKQRRLQEYEKAQTQQLLDWLEEETKRLIHAGLLPNFLPHSFSESDISSRDSTMSHSSSSSSLKPVHSQNPAVTRYFQQLIAQQKVYNYNSGYYSPEQIGIMEQVYGSTSPVTPGYPNHVSPPVMNAYLGQSPGQFGPGQYGQGYFPPVQNSASYQQQYQHHVKRSTSQTSADMGPSTEFILHTETGDISVTVPSVLVERIKDLPEDAQQNAVQSYCQQMAIKQQQEQQTVANQQWIAAQNQYATSQRLSPLEMENRNRSQVISPGGAYPQSPLIYQRNSNTLREAVPNFDAIGQSMSSGSYRSGSTDNETSRSMQSGLSSRMESNQPGPSVGQLGSNMDGNRSELQGIFLKIKNIFLVSNWLKTSFGDCIFAPCLSFCKSITLSSIKGF
ncbi:uncharacterized protein LOC128558972 isoform X1 [Mercenaria mercenaria]|uniref:uncharacterized protein LOC128558972 isoform X1 n=2 Tax=Mercenaria mercenaria TaxID=6596 RepID=UPI00234F22C9|nr:uncharacterized protein LOC128558972 isoform X1 [Mercenaria mercenaria]